MQPVAEPTVHARRVIAEFVEETVARQGRVVVAESGVRLDQHLRARVSELERSARIEHRAARTAARTIGGRLHREAECRLDRDVGDHAGRASRCDDRTRDHEGAGATSLDGTGPRACGEDVGGAATRNQDDIVDASRVHRQRADDRAVETAGLLSFVA